MPAKPGVPFLDTNVLLYLASDDEAKAHRAEQILREGGAISVQVLNEIANVGRRKMGMTWTEIGDFLLPLRELLTVVPVTEQVHEIGLRLAERYRFSIYDAMILAAARACGCEVVFSEDMHNDLHVEERLKIINPFKGL